MITNFAVSMEYVWEFSTKRLFGWQFWSTKNIWIINIIMAYQLGFPSLANRGGAPWNPSTPLFKSNRNLFSSVKRWYLFSMYRFEIFHVAWWGLLHSLWKISGVYVMAARLCEHSNLVRFEKRAAKTLQYGYRYVRTTREWVIFC